MAGLLLTTYAPAAAVKRGLYPNNRYAWDYMVRLITSQFSSLEKRVDLVRHALVAQLAADQLLGPTGRILPGKDAEVADSLVRMFFRLRRVVPELRARGRGTDLAMEQIRQVLVTAKLLDKEETLNGNQAEPKQVIIEKDLRARFGPATAQNSFFSLFEAVDALAETSHHRVGPGRLVDYFDVAVDVRGKALQVLQLILNKGHQSGLYSELLGLQRYWHDFLTQFRQGELIGEASDILRYVGRRANVLLNVAKRDGVFCPDDVVLPYTLARLPGAAKKNLIDALLGQGAFPRADQPLNYISLSSANLVSLSAPVVALRGVNHDLKDLGNCILIQYMSYVEVYSLNGRPLGGFYYAQPTNQGVRVIKRKDLKPFKKFSRSIEVVGKKDGRYPIY